MKEILTKRFSTAKKQKIPSLFSDCEGGWFIMDKNKYYL